MPLFAYPIWYTDAEAAALRAETGPDAGVIADSPADLGHDREPEAGG